MTTIWKLKQGADRRIRSGHPWVFSNELAVSPKGHPAGAPVELQDSKGQFVAHGYGNPHSLISFRALSFFNQDPEPTSYNSLHSKILTAWKIRKNVGYRGSFRLCFGESDYVPGIIIDYYRVQQNKKWGQVFAVQIVTAGISLALTDVALFFKELVLKAQHQGLTDLDWDSTAVVLRNDVGVRKLEGLTVDSPKILKNIENFNLSNIEIFLNSASSSDLISMSCDLAEGQKTGFFLDQTQNIFLAVNVFKNWALQTKPKKVKVLDLCCYVGHWSTQISKMLVDLGIEVEVHLVDVSQSALAFAKTNAERQGAKVYVHEMDVLTGLVQFESQSFDIVIADPPAFIKAKKDIPIGKHAYLKLNTQAFRLAGKERFVVSCSCSGLLEEEEFRDAIRKAALRNYPEIRSILRGGHAADHPTLMQFPEGFYLKMYTHMT